MYLYVFPHGTRVFTHEPQGEDAELVAVGAVVICRAIDDGFEQMLPDGTWVPVATGDPKQDLGIDREAAAMALSHPAELVVDVPDPVTEDPNVRPGMGG